MSICDSIIWSAVFLSFAVLSSTIMYSLSSYTTKTMKEVIRNPQCFEHSGVRANLNVFAGMYEFSLVIIILFFYSLLTFLKS